MPGLAAVVFDLDGTLVDTESVSEQVFREALAVLGHAITDDELLRLRGLAWPATGKWLLERFGVTRDEFRLHARPAWNAAFEAGVDTFADTMSVVATLASEGVPLAVCTSSGRGHLDRVLSSVPALSEVFRVTVSATDVARHKPDPEPYRQAVSRLGVPEDRTVAVEDTEIGVAAAVGAGLRVIGRPSGPPTDLSAAHLVVDELSRVDVDRVLT